MKIKNENGITLTVLIITVIVLIILATVTLTQIGDILDRVNKETISTDLLLIQAKAKVVEEKAIFNSEENLLKGQKLSEVTDNPIVNNLKENGILSETEEQYEQYYIWDKETIEELDLGLENIKNEDFYIVNYVTEEVIYPNGYKHIDGNIYYKLSEITNLEF